MVNLSLLSLRVVKEKSGRYDVSKKISTPKDAYDIAVEVLELDSMAEEVMAIYSLDTKNKVTGIFKVSHGSLNASIVHPREIFKRAIVNNAASIILLHNHPSGNPVPSKEDIDITKRIVDAGNLLGITVLDHIIVGETEYYSLKENGYI